MYLEDREKISMLDKVAILQRGEKVVDVEKSMGKPMYDQVQQSDDFSGTFLARELDYALVQCAKWIANEKLD